MLLKLIGLIEKSIDDEEKIPIRVDYVEKREIDRSALSSFDGSFQLIHADVGNLESLGKNATTPRYVLLAVDLYFSKVYVYPMCSREQILHKNETILWRYKKQEKYKKKTMHLQVDNEFQQVKLQISMMTTT